MLLQCGLLGVVIGLSGPSQSPAPDGALAVVDKAIVAAGGEAKLKAVKAFVWHTKDALQGPVGKVTGSRENFIQLPDKFHTNVEFEANQREVKVVIVVAGEKGWIRQGARSDEMASPALLDEQEEIYQTSLCYLPVLLKDSAIKLVVLPDEKVGDRPVQGIMATNAKHRELRLYYDKETGVLLKSESRVPSKPGSKDEVRLESVHTEHRSAGGITIPFRSKTQRDGKPSVESEITEMRFLSEVLAPELFTKP